MLSLFPMNLFSLQGPTAKGEMKSVKLVCFVLSDVSNSDWKDLEVCLLILPRLPAKTKEGERGHVQAVCDKEAVKCFSTIGCEYDMLSIPDTEWQLDRSVTNSYSHKSICGGSCDDGSYSGCGSGDGT